MAKGFVDAAEIKDLKVRVFVSHSHVEHFDRVILDWQKTVPDIQYFFGWQAMEGEGFHAFSGPRASLTLPGLEIFTVSSRHAGVDEEAFLVEVDGLVLFHGGDYQGRMGRGAASNAAEGMRYLRTNAEEPDLMFLGAWTGEPYLEVIRGLEPRVIFPGHERKREEHYRTFAAELQELGLRIPVPCPERRGDSFVYRGGAIAGGPLTPPGRASPRR